MLNVQDIVLHNNQIKKLVASKTPTGRASKTDVKAEMLLKIFLKAKNTNNAGYQKFFLGYFRSLGCERTIRRNINSLVSLGYISKSIKTIHVSKKIKSILYIKLELENIITTLKKMESEKPIGGQKCPANRDNIINNNIYYKNNLKNISDTPNDSSSNSLDDSSDITNILINLNPIEPIQSPTPIKTLKPYIQKNNILSVEAELVELMSAAGVSYTEATIASILKYFSNKNIIFDSKRKLIAYAKKLTASLTKIQTSFNEASVSVSTLPTYYDEKYNSFAYWSKDIEATQELLDKVNTSANTNHTQETLKSILRDLNKWFTKPEILISVLAERFKKEPNRKPSNEYYVEFTKEYRAKRKEEERKLSKYFREGYKIGQTYEDWLEKQLLIN